MTTNATYIKSRIVCLMAGLMLLASCATKKSAGTTGNMAYTGELLPLATIVEKINENQKTEQSLTARLSMNMAGGKHSLTIGGNIKMKRNDVIQMSLVAFGLVEVASIELTKDYFLLVDRQGRNYVKESYNNVPFFKQSGINFYTFQALFWSDLFLLGESGKMPAENKFTKELNDGIVTLSNTDNRTADVTFLANLLSGLIQQTNVTAKAGQLTASAQTAPELQWRYLSFAQLGEGNIPSKMEIQFNGLMEKPVGATLTLSNIKSDDSWNTRLDLNKKRYTQIDAQTLLRRIMSLSH